MKRFTPGPWISGFLESGWSLISQVDGKCIMFTEKNEGGILPTEADAKLIAAAPDLLKTLKDLLAWCERYAPPESHHYELTGARAAIAKAGN